MHALSRGVAQVHTAISRRTCAPASRAAFITLLMSVGGMPSGCSSRSITSSSSRCAPSSSFLSASYCAFLAAISEESSWYADEAQTHSHRLVESCEPAPIYGRGRMHALSRGVAQVGRELRARTEAMALDVLREVLGDPLDLMPLVRLGAPLVDLDLEAAHLGEGEGEGEGEGPTWCAPRGSRPRGRAPRRKTCPTCRASSGRSSWRPP